MSPRTFRRVGAAASAGRAGGTATPATPVLPLAGAASLAVDADAVRRRLGAWIATQPAAERPAVEPIWRDGVLVCDEIVALARSTLGSGAMPLWAVDVPLPADAQLHARLAGLAPRAIHRAVDALIAAEVLDGVSQIGRERVVRVRSEILSDAPVLAAVRWDVVRERLSGGDTPIARLIVRELARRTSPEARAQAHFVSASQRELADAVGYSKAAMRRHLDALVDAGLLLSRSRDRANSWHRLQPVVFDGPLPQPASRPEPARPAIALDRSPVQVATAARRAPDTVATPGAGAPPVGLPPAPSPAQDRAPRAVPAALTLEVNGVRVALPPGVELTLEQDDAGALWYRAGALRLGPVRFE